MPLVTDQSLAVVSDEATWRKDGGAKLTGILMTTTMQEELHVVQNAYDRVLCGLKKHGESIKAQVLKIKSF